MSHSSAPNSHSDGLVSTVLADKVFQLEKGITMNAFIEPQYTVWHAGPGAPRWQIFAGVNFQFPVGK